MSISYPFSLQELEVLPLEPGTVFWCGIFLVVSWGFLFCLKAKKKVLGALQQFHSSLNSFFVSLVILMHYCSVRCYGEQSRTCRVMEIGNPVISPDL